MAIALISTFRSRHLMSRNSEPALQYPIRISGKACAKIMAVLSRLYILIHFSKSNKGRVAKICIYFLEVSKYRCTKVINRGRL